MFPAQSFWPGLGGTETRKVQEGVLWGLSDRGSPEACTLLTLPHARREPLAASECSLEIGPTLSVHDSSEWVLAGPRAQAAGCSESVAVQAAQGFPGDREGF